MADMKFKFDMDLSSVLAAFDVLDGPFKESLARKMLVEGGVLLRDQATANALIPDNKESAERRGVLAAAMYLVFNKEESTQTLFTYKVSWNAKQAPHGHLIEFGHWRNQKVYKAANGQWYTIKDEFLDTPKWVAARPFLGPAFDQYGGIAIKNMLDRGKREFASTLAEFRQ